MGTQWRRLLCGLRDKLRSENEGSFPEEDKGGSIPAAEKARTKVERRERASSMWGVKGGPGKPE